MYYIKVYSKLMNIIYKLWYNLRKALNFQIFGPGTNLLTYWTQILTYTKIG